MKYIIAILTLAFTAHHAGAEDAGFRVVINSPQEERSIVEVSSPQGLSYRVCEGFEPSLETAVLCAPLSEDIPDSVEAKEILDRNFATELGKTISREEKAGRPVRLALKSVRDGAFATILQTAIYAAIAGRAKATNPKVAAIGFGIYAGVSGLIYGIFDGPRPGRAQKLKPLAQPGLNSDLSKTRSIELQPSRIFDQKREMDFVIDAMTKALASTYANATVAAG